MNFEKICKYLGYALVFLFLIYVSCKLLSVETSFIEGLTNSTDKKTNNYDPYSSSNKQLKDNNQKQHDALLLNKYESGVEDLILDLNENTQLEIIQLLIIYAGLSAKENPSSEDQDKKTKLLDGINKLQTFKVTLNSAMLYLKDHTSNK